ncbi:MAG: tetratricopeptide repeat protein [Prevotellaceae bacterium]|nr:tetratricopeptide repeat protein [Prevotellaceae bacterium]
MKHFFILLLTLCCLPAAAQTESVVNIFTYKADGSLHKSGYGFFATADGQTVAPYDLFDGAVRAEVVDAKGRTWPVFRILGANSSYGIVRCSVEGLKNAPFLACGKGASAGEAVALSAYAAKKKEKPLPATVTTAEAYDNYSYYSLSAPNEEKYFGCPVTNAAGSVVAIAQRNAASGATTLCALDARFADSLRVSALSALDRDLRAIAIPKAIPAAQEDARTYIYMLSNADSLSAVTAMNDFVAAWPGDADGCLMRGDFFVATGDSVRAEADYAKALALAAAVSPGAEANVHYNISRAVLAQAAMRRIPGSPDWTFSRAEAEAAEACRLSDNPLFFMQHGQCLYALCDYRRAYESFLAASTGSFASPQTYFSAARSLELAGGSADSVICLLDSAVACIPRPCSAADASFYYERATRLVQVEKYRAAVADYNEYEKAVGPRNLTDVFYFFREQAEIAGRMYQQALDDIRTAASMRPDNPVYRLEEAAILLQVGLFEEAIASAGQAIGLQPENADGYKIKGIAQGELGQKKAAAESFRRAQELGDEDATGLLRKYQP